MRVGDPPFTRPRCHWTKCPPDVRVWWALWRCSKNKWISPDEVWELGMRFAVCISDTPGRTVRSAVQGSNNTQDAVDVGMLRGYPPFERGEPAFETFREIACRPTKRRRNAIPIELVILNLKLKEYKHGTD